MSFKINVIDLAQACRRILSGHPKMAWDRSFRMPRETVENALTDLVRGHLPPIVIYTDSTGATVTEGVIQIAVVVGALYAREEHGLDLPDYFDHLHVVGLSVGGQPRVLLKRGGGPAALPMGALLETADWQAWADNLQSSDIEDRQKILDRAHYVARAVLDARVVWVQAPPEVDMAQLNRMIDSSWGR